MVGEGSALEVCRKKESTSALPRNKFNGEGKGKDAPNSGREPDAYRRAPPLLCHARKILPGARLLAKIGDARQTRPGA